MKQLKQYYFSNPLKRSLIKLPIVLFIWATYIYLMYGVSFPLLLYTALVFTALYLMFTFNLEGGRRKLIAMSEDFYSSLTFYPLVRGILSSLLILAMAFFAMRLWQDHRSWQQSFEIALQFWIPITLISLMEDMERWLLHKHSKTLNH